MGPAEPQVEDTVRNHWWWRPGWRTGRHFYACHLTLDDQPQLRALVRQYQDAMADLPNLDLIPARWLHITMQGIGFTDEISTADLAAVTGQLEERLRSTEPPVATFYRPTIHPEAIILVANPIEPMYRLRLAMYEAIASALGPEKFSEGMPEPAQFTPHVSVAYVNSNGPVQPITDALSKINPKPVTTTFRTASLLVFHRDNQMYEWTRATSLPIGTTNVPEMSSSMPGLT